MKILNRSSGFTMIELLFVLVVMGFMLAVITPRAYRANIDSKYGALRQECAELVSYATEWANQGIISQEQELSTSSFDSYMRSIAGQVPGTAIFPNAEWIAGTDISGASNWNAATPLRGILGRDGDVAGADDPPENAIQDLIPLTKVPVNPFNGVNVFTSAANDPATVGNTVTGAIACGGVDEGGGSGWHYYALVFQGTDNTGGVALNPSGAGVFYAGQDTATLAGLRNGIFLARER